MSVTFANVWAACCVGSTSYNTILYTAVITGRGFYVAQNRTRLAQSKRQPSQNSNIIILSKDTVCPCHLICETDWFIMFASPKWLLFQCHSKDFDAQLAAYTGTSHCHLFTKSDNLCHLHPKSCQHPLMTLHFCLGFLFNLNFEVWMMQFSQMLTITL